MAWEGITGQTVVCPTISSLGLRQQSVLITICFSDGH